MFAWSPRSFSSTLFGMKKGFVIFQTFFLVKILLKLLKIWLLNLTFLLVIEGNITHWWMAFIWTGFKTPRTFKKMSLIKSVLLLWVKRKSQSMFIPFWGTRHQLRLKTNGLIVWMSWMKWNGIIFIMSTSSAPLKPRWGLFILNFFIRQSVLINFSIELVDPILPTVIFVIIYQKLFCTYFVNVKKFPPFGMNYVFWLIIFLGNPLLSQILKKCLVSQTSQNMTTVLISSFYAWNFIFIDANFSKPTPILLHF